MKWLLIFFPFERQLNHFDGTVGPGSLDPFYSYMITFLLYENGHDFFDIWYKRAHQ